MLQSKCVCVCVCVCVYIYSTQESRLGVVDEVGPMGESLTGENLTETVPSVWSGIVYEVTLDVNISKRQIGTFSPDFSGVSSSLDSK